MFWSGLLVLGLLSFPAVARAQGFNHTITVYAVVPEQRAIYLDQYGAVIKIAGNTDKNVPPQVYDSSNRKVPISPVIQEQYVKFLNKHNYRLAAGKVYKINPLRLDYSANSQTISLDTRPAVLTLSLR